MMDLSMVVSPRVWDVAGMFEMVSGP
jgi:hypothetical protein